MELIDVHCHLTLPPLLMGIEQVLEQAREARVVAVVTAAVDPEDWDPIERLLAQPGVFAALGVHPYHAGRVDPLALRGLLAPRLGRPKIVAVGEVGLDGAAEPAMERQLALLRVQLELAREHALPVVLHCHRAHEALLAELRTVGGGGAGAWRGVVHGFSRGLELAERYLALGLSVGLGGRLLDQRAARLRELAGALPLERLLLETDASSAAIGERQRGASGPADLPLVAGVLAELRGISVEVVAGETTRHARELFAFDP